MPAPEPGELLADRRQRRDDLRRPRPRTVPGVRGVQVRRDQPALVRPVGLRVDQPGGRVGEPPVVQAARQPLVSHLVPEQRDGEPGLPQRLAQRADHLRGRVLQPVEDAHHSRVDVVGPRRAPRHGVTRELEQVVTLLHGQPQAAGQRRQDLLGGVRAARLFKPAVVVDRHVREDRDLLAAQTPGTAPAAAGQADVLGLQGLPAGAQEVGKVGRGPSQTPANWTWASSADRSQSLRAAASSRAAR